MRDSRDPDNPALSEMLLEGEGYDPPAPRVFTDPAPQPPPPGLSWEPVLDWHEEAAANARALAEQEEVSQNAPNVRNGTDEASPEATPEGVAPRVEPPVQPAKPKQKSSKTPNLDKVRGWVSRS
jgi:hypothetical protein